MEGAVFDISMTNHEPAAFEVAARVAGFLSFGIYARAGIIDIGPALG